MGIQIGYEWHTPQREQFAQFASVAISSGLLAKSFPRIQTPGVHVLIGADENEPDEQSVLDVTVQGYLKDPSRPLHGRVWP